MSLKKNALGTSGLNIILAVAELVLITTSLAIPTGAQQAGLPTAEEQEVEIEDLFILPGVQLAASVDKQPSGPLKIQSYKLEEVTLPRPIKLGEARIIKSVQRLTVTLGSPLQGDYTIFVDDEAKNAFITRDGVTAIFFNPGELEDGAQISVARGEACNTRLSSTMKSKLRLPEAYKLTKRGDADPGLGLKKIRTIRARQSSQDRDEVEIELTTAVPFPASNEVLVMELGGVEILGGGYVYGKPNTIIFRMSAEEFSRAEDGKRIKVKFGRCSSGGARFGKLNKAQLDQ
ncbi:MAG TPA: hypothetical protein VMM84_18025 [Pyrinomonadaceae bacterium]|nr:hypothetical protein [Pyrinomonadaceae bacterium]